MAGRLLLVHAAAADEDVLVTTRVAGDAARAADSTDATLLASPPTTWMHTTVSLSCGARDCRLGLS